MERISLDVAALVVSVLATLVVPLGVYILRKHSEVQMLISRLEVTEARVRDLASEFGEFAHLIRAQTERLARIETLTEVIGRALNVHAHPKEVGK